MRPLYLLTVILASVSAHAAEGDACFRNSLPFFQTVSRVSESASAKAAALATACQELADDGLMAGRSTAMHIFDTVGNFVGGIEIGHAPSAFATLQGSDLQRRYMAELIRIKHIADPMERIRQTYELAARNSGQYDHQTNGLATWRSGLLVGAHMPGNLLNNFERRGTVGVCREYAALLNWSLLQVSRYSGSTSMALGPTDFSSDLIMSSVPGGGHAWVRINLPVIENGQLRDFTHFDLDTTWYSTFTPLFPRRSGLSAANRSRAIRECNDIQSCLVESSMSMVYSSSRTAPTEKGRGAQ